MFRKGILLLIVLLLLAGQTAVYADTEKTITSPEDAAELVEGILGEDPASLDGQYRMTDQMESAVRKGGGFEGLAKSLVFLGKVKEIQTPYESEMSGMRVFRVPCVFGFLKLDLAVLSSDLASLPGDATMITMVNPTADLSAEEAQKLNSYLEASGQLFLITAPEQDPDSLPRLKEIMDAHGITEVPGIVIESEDHAYSKDAPYSFKPRMLVHPVNEEAGYSEKSVLLSEVQALSVRNTDIATASPLLLSSEDAYSKVDGYNITTYSKEARDISGPLTLAALSEGDHGRIIWIASASIIDEAANETSEGGNRYFIYGALRYFGADASWDPIQPTLYNYGLMRMNETLVSRLGLIFVGVFPIFYLLIGGVFWALKKRAEFILQAEEEEKARQAQEEERRREEQEAEERREAFRKARREAAIKAKEERKKKENRE